MTALGLGFDDMGTKLFVVDSPDDFAVAEYVLGTFDAGIRDDNAPAALYIKRADPLGSAQPA